MDTRSIALAVLIAIISYFGYQFFADNSKKKKTVKGEKWKSAMVDDTHKYDNVTKREASNKEATQGSRAKMVATQRSDRKSIQNQPAAEQRSTKSATKKADSPRRVRSSDVVSISLAPMVQEKKQLGSVLLAPTSPACEVSMNLAPVPPSLGTDSEMSKNSKKNDRKKKEKMPAANVPAEEELGVKTAQEISGDEEKGVKTAELFSDGGETKNVVTAKAIE